jgi:hypothetical protein
MQKAREGGGVKRYVWFISFPGGRRGWELWLGPVGLIATRPVRFPLAWSWGWWRV